MNDVLDWLTASAHWSGEDGISHRILEHLYYSGVALLIAAVIAIPLGLFVGHTGRGRFVVVNAAGAARAIPSLGLLFVAVLLLGPRLSGDTAFVVPCELVLVVLAIPPILAGAYAGVEEVDPAVRDYGQMAAGAVLVGVLALAVDLVFAVVQRYAVSPGLTGRFAARLRAERKEAPDPLTVIT